MARTKLLNGEVVALTPEEESARDAEEAQAAEEKAAHDADHTWKRKAEYPPIGDQLDAILKWANLMRMDGTNLPEDLDQTIAAWLSVKQKYPKS